MTTPQRNSIAKISEDAETLKQLHDAARRLDRQGASISHNQNMLAVSQAIRIEAKLLLSVSQTSESLQHVLYAAVAQLLKDAATLDRLHDEAVSQGVQCAAQLIIDDVELLKRVCKASEIQGIVEQRLCEINLAEDLLRNAALSDRLEVEAARVRPSGIRGAIGKFLKKSGLLD